MNIAYVRTSTEQQNEARQVENLTKYDITKWFTEKVSAKDTKRPELQAMLEFCREGDTLYIHDFSRIARSTKDLLSIVELLNDKGVHLVSTKESLDTNTPTGKLMLTMLSAIYEFERTNLLERQKEGITIAKRAGKYQGRKKVTIANINEHYHRYMHREVSKSELSKELKVSRPTLDRLFKELSQQLEAQSI